MSASGSAFHVLLAEDVITKAETYVASAVCRLIEALEKQNVSGYPFV